MTNPIHYIRHTVSPIGKAFVDHYTVPTSQPFPGNYVDLVDAWTGEVLLQVRDARRPLRIVRNYALKHGLTLVPAPPR